MRTLALPAVVPAAVTAGRQAFADAAAPKFFVTLLGTGHNDGYYGGTSAVAAVVRATTPDFFDRYVQGHGVASGTAIEK